MNILVARGGALGDFILTLPVLAALRTHFPGGRLEMLGNPAYGALAVEARLADEVHALESRRFTPLFTTDGLAPDDLKQWLASFDYVVSYLYDPEGIFSSNIRRDCPGQFIAGPHRPDEGLAVHATTQLLAPLKLIGITGADPQPRLRVGKPEKVRRVALHPGSGSPRKNWPEDKWAGFIGSLKVEILLIGGEAEGDRCARLAANLPPAQVQIAQSLSLVELARRMQRCSAFVGHDSGITHLAAALDLPGVVLWGESSLATWRPQSERLKILRDPGGLANLPVAAVRDALLCVH